MHRVLVCSRSIGYQKHRIVSYMTAANNSKRLKLCMLHVNYKKEGLRNVVFSEKEEFNLHGLKGWAYYWHDLEKHEEIISQRHYSFGSLIIWSLLSCHESGPIFLWMGDVSLVSTVICCRSIFYPALVLLIRIDIYFIRIMPL